MRGVVFHNHEFRARRICYLCQTRLTSAISVPSCNACSGLKWTRRKIKCCEAACTKAGRRWCSLTQQRLCQMHYVRTDIENRACVVCRMRGRREDETEYAEFCRRCVE